MTQYKATINGTSVFGNLMWNPNGSLKQLAITDPFNSSDTQTCSYSQGDLAAISGVNCGSVWSQTFSYDPFGNITKSGSISWMPGYNPATNRYMLVGTSYDADGSLLTDTFHTYTWNSDGHPATVNSRTLVTLTYDALGRVVALNDAGTKSDIAYTPSGRRFAYYPNGAFGGFTLDLPGILRGGGQTANAGIQSYSHPDWLGSQRVVSAGNRTYVGSLAYAPFGETYSQLGSAQLLFANQPTDIANDLHDFPARELHDRQGRWISPDPAGMTAADPTNPQSWNRYAYVLNSPLSNIDPDGLACIYLNDAGDGSDIGANGVDNASSFDECKLTNGKWLNGTIQVGSVGANPDTGLVWGQNTEGYWVTNQPGDSVDVIGPSNPLLGTISAAEPGAKSSTCFGEALGDVAERTCPFRFSPPGTKPLRHSYCSCHRACLGGIGEGPPGQSRSQGSGATNCAIARIEDFRQGSFERL